MIGRSFKTRIPGVAAGLLLLSAASYGGYRAASVSSTVTASMASVQSSPLDLGTASYSPSQSYRASFTDGTGNYQFKVVFADTNRLAASDSALIDLAGSTADAFGTTIACATLKGVMVQADSANTNDVLVGGAKVAAVQFLGAVLADTTHVVPVGPGGVFLWARPKTGVTVTGGARDIIRIKNAGASTTVKYIVQILCR